MNKIIVPILVAILVVGTIYGIRYKTIITEYFSSPVQEQQEEQKPATKCAAAFGTEDIGRRFYLESSYQDSRNFTGLVKEVDCETGEVEIELFETKSQSRSKITYIKGTNIWGGFYWEGEKAPEPKAAASPSPTPKDSDKSDKEALEKTLKEIEATEDEVKKAARELKEAKELNEKLDREIKILERKREILRNKN